MDKRIVIIGAGAAGVAAGTRLLAAGFSDVTVLESESRLGGRVNTVAHGTGVIDLGAQWCHGEENNVVYALAKDHDLLGTGRFVPAGIEFIQSNGTHVDDKSLLKLSDLLDISEEEARRNEGRSVGDVIRDKFKQTMNEEPYRTLDATLQDQILQSLHRQNNVMMASDNWDELSLSGYMAFEESAGNQMWTWKGRGYRTVFDLLLKKLPTTEQAIPLEERIVYGKTVRRIDWSESDRARVECTDGSEFSADHVIWTGSLGVLREQHENLFHPVLPERKSNAIGAHKLGTVAKIFVEFPSAIWTNEAWTGFTTLWRPEELDELRGTPDEWLTSVSGVYRVDFHDYLLFAWIAGDHARQMAKLPEQQVQDGLMRLLRMFLNDRTIPEPTAFRRSSWSEQANFRGTYSYQTRSADELHVTRADIAEPLVRNGADVPAVQFAGEATSTQHYGTVHGAIETGWREADRLIALYK